MPEVLEAKAGPLVPQHPPLRHPWDARGVAGVGNLDPLLSEGCRLLVGYDRVAERQRLAHQEVVAHRQELGRSTLVVLTAGWYAARIEDNGTNSSAATPLHHRSLRLPSSSWARSGRETADSPKLR